MLKGTKVYSVLNMRCPRCQQGKVFKNSNPFQSKFDEMHETCPHCGLKYERETGFFYGSMYVAYALSVAISVSVYVAIYTFVDIPLWLYLIFNAIVLVVMVPVTFRLARMMWLNFFVRYAPEKRGNDPF